MARDFCADNIRIDANIAPCVTRCRFCQMLFRHKASFSMERYSRLVNRFFEAEGETGLKVHPLVGFSAEMNVEEYAECLNLYRRSGWDLRTILINGLRYRSDKEIEAWLLERKTLGIDSIALSYIGTGSLHDYWNHKDGHFVYQTNFQKIAANVGISAHEQLLLMQSALPLMEELLDALDAIGNASLRRAYPLLYSGMGRNCEHERITRALLEKQPQRIRNVYGSDRDIWATEKEWAERVAKGEGCTPHTQIWLRVTDANIDSLEKTSCTAIADAIIRKTKEVYTTLPSLEELAEKYSDPTNEKLYPFIWDMEALWLDRYEKHNPGPRLQREYTYIR